VDLGLSGRFFVVGGGARGLGRATADVLVAEGASVLLVGRDGDALQAACSELGDSVSWLAGDMADPALPPLVRSRVGDSLDGLLLNAGGPPPGDALTLTDEQWRGAYELLIGGPLRVLREVAALFSNGSSGVCGGCRGSAAGPAWGCGASSPCCSRRARRSCGSDRRRGASRSRASTPRTRS